MRITCGDMYSNVVNPDQITVVEGDSVTAPDVLRVEVGDGDVSVVYLSSSFYLSLRDSRSKKKKKENKKKLTG